jgi:hypothetical protein
MKKLIMSLLFVGLLGGASLQAGTFTPKPHKVTHNKATSDTKKAGKKGERGVKHGAYDATHNKATKKTHVNRGNRKYSNQNDIR